MRNGKYQSRKQGFNARPVALLLAVLLLIGVSVGGTLAWLTAKSEVVTNTFTDSDINITLKETKEDFKMIPGWTIEKDPVVTVEAGSEDCWLFVKITESTNPDLDAYITYAIASGWETVQPEDDNGVTVIGRKVYKNAEIKSFAIIGYTDTKGTESADDDQFVNNTVLVNETVTKQMMDALNEEGATKPSLTFTAYAVQLYKSNGVEFGVSEAWTNAQNAANQQTGTTN